jgi:hypothetical protein
VALRQEPHIQLYPYEDAADFTKPPWVAHSHSRLKRWLQYKLRNLHVPQLTSIHIRFDLT